MSATIAGIGTALPGLAAEQQALWDGFFRSHFATSRLAERIFAGSGVLRRHTVADPLTEDLSGWSTEQRMRRYVREAEPLGHRATIAALAEAGVATEDIGLLTVASCTGYSTPGLDIRLATSLSLRSDVQRLFVGHMGCYAALPALGSAADFVVARQRPAVLLCLELTSLHVQPPTRDPQQMVSHALFGDAAAAVVLTPDHAHAAGSRRVGSRRVGSRSSPLHLVDLAAMTDVSTSDHMTWDVTDLGFRMGLSPKVPAVLSQHVRPVVCDLLGRHGLDVPDVRGWAVHPGGPAILSTVQQELDLPPEALESSRSVLAEQGNCSSPTVLLILEKLLGRDDPEGAGPVVAMAFGPGLTLYAALLSGDPELW
ncbi:putative naringenin-chalcone synthase [Haloactinomyces albus]|uniref:Naringenin-chalcone synthase n=1 Tax=Haloactinomyces albus TaxID=1352928 RepID=A0AAE4CK95_9ACTN|nr:type III polyketide synthase [Haloactinomyces albus]MDR7300101.1 putative naringenin-chalcone synthase [Haloactinomyces albus]